MLVDKVDINKFIADDYIALALFDMDLSDPTYNALEWIFPKLQSGSILIFDEFLGFSGDESRGECHAWRSFLIVHPEVASREFFKYGDGGVAFQITMLND